MSVLRTYLLFPGISDQAAKVRPWRRKLRRLPNHASYLQSWLKAMQNDHRFIFQAASQANKVADYILAFSRTSVEEREEALVE